MINVLIFAAHIIFAVVIFVKKYQDDGISGAFQNLALVILLFAVGWSVTGMLTKFLFYIEGLDQVINKLKVYDKNFDGFSVISLSLLTIAEYFFYRFYYGEKTTEDEKEKLS